jgi:hypothetical protein
MSTAPWMRTLITVTLASLLALTSCGRTVVDPGTSQATLSIRADLSGTLVATVVVDVTAPDIPTGLVFNIPIVTGVASGTITVPAGSNRTIALRAYDAGGVETNSGSVMVSIQPGANATISIVLTPLTGDLPITATLGTFVVGVTPTAAGLHLAGPGTVQLTAAITDSRGIPTTGAVAWATRNPGVAVVDGAGLVTATGVGTTTISAAFQGVAGTATITVTP